MYEDFELGYERLELGYEYFFWISFFPNVVSILFMLHKYAK